MKIITKKQAIGLGYKRYFTGIPCKNNHVSERLVSDGSCVECKREIRTRMKEKNPTYFSEYTTSWQRKNPDRTKQHKQRTYKNTTYNELRMLKIGE